MRWEVFKNGRWVKDADNFGKIERIHDPDVETFRDEVWQLAAAGKTFQAWRSFVKSTEIKLDDTDLDAAQQSALQELADATEVVTLAGEHREAIVRAALNLGLAAKDIAKATGLTKARVEKIAAGE